MQINNKIYDRSIKTGTDIYASRKPAFTVIHTIFYYKK